MNVAYLMDTVLRGIRVVSRGGVVRVDDGADTWLCWEREWDAMIERVRSGELQLPRGDEESEAEAYGRICHATRGPVLTAIGSSRGSDEERDALRSAALKAEIIESDHATVRGS